jgi:hypothetical protein
MIEFSFNHVLFPLLRQEEGWDEGIRPKLFRAASIVC